MDLYDSKITALCDLKRIQTREKIEYEGLLDEDDYGRIVPPKGHWNIIPNHPDGSFYGFDAWTDNFCSLMDAHPLYLNKYDVFAGRWMYFMSKMRKNKWNPDYPYTFLKPNIEKYDIICGIGDDAHFAPDFQLGVKLGWQGILDKIAYYEAINTTPEQQHFYELHKRAVRSIQGWIKRHIDEAKRLATLTSVEEEKEHFWQIAETNEAILNNPPQTFRQACQWIIWYHLASRTYNRDGAGDQLDVLLYPFYQQDLQEGRINRETAIYWLACFLINDPIYWQLGGPDENGKDQTNEVSFLILEAADKINTSLNITVRVHDELNPELLRKSVEYLVKNKNGWPRFSGNDALVKGFMRNGYNVGLARKRIAVGCNWMSIPGMEYTMNDLVKINMAKVFEVAFNEMMECGKKYSIQRLWELFSTHLDIAVQTAADGIRHHLKYQRYNEPELILNLLSHGPLEKGCDVAAGGAKFLNLAIDGAGIAIVADSFAALQQRVEEEKRITWEEVALQLQNNYAGAEGEKVRSLMRTSQRYGAQDSLGEIWALQISKLFTNLVIRQSDEKTGQRYIPGFFSWANTVGFGEHVGATPDGRLAGTPISHGANPSPGFVSDGASLALATAIAKIQPGYGNTAPMQWELDPGFAKQENVDVIMAIIKTHCKLGGTLINVNIMNKEVVLEAHKDPSKYPDLVVRVTGFTAYFCMLSPQFRQLVVDRILEN
ncbi:pyruvate formate lyase family protein [Bacteroides sp.]